MGGSCLEAVAAFAASSSLEENARFAQRAAARQMIGKDVVFFVFFFYRGR
jgi:hypothetical protein